MYKKDNHDIINIVKNDKQRNDLLKVRLEEFKSDVLQRLKDDLYNVAIVDSNDKEIKTFNYCNTERILMFIADYGDVLQEDNELYINVVIYKEFIRIKTKDNGFISVDLSIKQQ